MTSSDNSCRDGGAAGSKQAERKTESAPKKVLIATFGMDCGGIENFLVNLLRNADAGRFKFDFSLIRNREYFYSGEIKKRGCGVYTYPFSFKCKLLLGFYALSLFGTLLRGGYDVVHANFHWANGPALAIARICGVKKRIAHIHTTADGFPDNFFGGLLRFFMRRVIIAFSTDRIACSREAGLKVYGSREEFSVVRNAVDVRRFSYDELKRTRMRRLLGFGDKTVIGHMGRFEKVKNHVFLLEIFSRFLKTSPDSVLALAGGGSLEPFIKERAASMNLSDKVFFLGVRADNAELYQAFDAFVLPSFHEGLPLCGIEAQISGLPCFFSDAVSRETEIAGCSFLSLSAGAELWAEALRRKLEGYVRKDMSAEAVKRHFDIRYAAEKISEIYLR